MTKITGAILGLLLLNLSGCSNQIFVQKDRQTDKAFETDMSYCRSVALGGFQDQNGTSGIQIRAQSSVPMSYEDCMRQMGYQQQ